MANKYIRLYIHTYIHTYIHLIFDTLLSGLSRNEIVNKNEVFIDEISKSINENASDTSSQLLSFTSQFKTTL